MNPQHRGLNRKGRTPKVGTGLHLVTRKRAGGRTVVQAAARGAHDTRVHLGHFLTEDEARAAYALYVETGERPYLLRKGAKLGSRQTVRRKAAVPRVVTPKLPRPITAAPASRVEMMKRVYLMMEGR